MLSRLGGGDRGLSIPRANLDERQTAMLGLALVAAIAVGAYMLAPVMKSRLAKMPIAGQAQQHQASTAGLSNPMELPVALAIPPEGSQVVVDDSLERIEEMFLPSVVEAPVVHETDAQTKAEEMIRQSLATIRLDAASNTGAFLSGRFYRFGEKLGLEFPDGNGGAVQAYLAGYSGGRALIKAGSVALWIGEQ